MDIYDDILNIDETRLIEAWEKFAEQVSCLSGKEKFDLNAVPNTWNDYRIHGILHRSGTNSGWTILSHYGHPDAENQRENPRSHQIKTKEVGAHKYGI
jgi:hypothetical protein